ncbi:MAG: efflux RND transporter periplasmic adaptor subunit [Gammaproteobacteria bacterium]|nr:efflux RND transporter periplasmic adaptor subunit [Gammaproteobacteria bacterium]
MSVRYPLSMSKLWILIGLLAAGTGFAQMANAPVVVTIVDNGPVVEEIALTGTVTSPQFARVSAAVDGQVAEVLVDAGARVNAGDELVRLDDEIATLELRAARAEVFQAEAQLADSRRRLAEARRLGEENSIATTEIESRAARVKIDEASLARLKANADRQGALLARHWVRAPFDGVIRSKLTEAGAWVTPGLPVVELVATTGLRLDFQAPQEYLSRIGPETILLVRDGSGELVRAEIDTVVPVTDQTARTFLLRASAGAHTGLVPGMSAHAVLRLSSGRENVLIPRDALVRYPDGRTTVWLVEQSADVARVAERQVQTGTVAAGLVEIRSGLSGGERVVVRGNEALRNGQEVSVTVSAANR